MAELHQVRFDDGAAYEKLMGIWSRIAGEVFLDWVKPASGLAWADVGCGNGAFTELLCARCAPSLVEGVDPSEGQLAYARTRPGTGPARFRQGDAMALPLADASLDAAVMALVLFFVPEPAQGVAEMARVVRPGGLVCAYAWDVEGGGFPLEPVWAEQVALGLPRAGPPRPEAARLDVMEALWRGAGLEAVETTVITVERRFADFEAWWDAARAGSVMRSIADKLSPEQQAALKEGVQRRIGAAETGPVATSARAHAVKGRRPG